MLSNTCYWWRSFWPAINIAQPKSFFSAGIQKLVERYKKCIVLQGDYVEKWYVKLLTVTCIKAVKCILPLLFDSPSYTTLGWQRNAGLRQGINPELLYKWVNILREGSDIWLFVSIWSVRYWVLLAVTISIDPIADLWNHKVLLLSYLYLHVPAGFPWYTIFRELR